MTSVHPNIELQKDNSPVTMVSSYPSLHSDGGPATSFPDRSSSVAPATPREARGRSTSIPSQDYSRHTSRSPGKGKGRARYSPYPGALHHQIRGIKVGDLVDSFGGELPSWILTSSDTGLPEPDDISEDALALMIDMERSALTARVQECTALDSKIREKELQIQFLKYIRDTEANCIHVAEKNLHKLEAFAHEHGMDIEPAIQAFAAGRRAP
ncbi:uncharacterized protein B0H18DRAFT_1117423 [Fomitopsis serialis]|uniref:uncharacterized protein n=1 Tax=Fomitopsis serialis TaxID=139415 RepID=UPI0020081B94|nr:uncharacterized protein B0H18DRAFT_1117423 [Neoantrodia serialis]KAH9929384.1 hypothetical protein B0H18DRAFT_1117423 [Neoantrodia serialis]